MNNDRKKFEEQIAAMYVQRMEILKRSISSISFSKPLISKDGLGIIYPNTITTIQGKKGVHKSRLTETICARLLDESLKRDHLGMSLDSEKTIYLLYVDTERNQRDQFPYAIQTIRKRAGFKKEDQVENLDVLSLINVSRPNRFKALELHINRVKEERAGMHVIIVFDVITDCIGNFNDVNQSMEVIDMMNDLINTADVSFITVIHENPNGEKARGHLGSEIINKSSQVIQIGKDSELITVKFIHSRNTGTIPEWYLQYDPLSRGLIRASQFTVDTAKAKKQTAAPLSDLRHYLCSLGENTFDKNALYEKIKTRFEVSERTIYDRLKSLESEGIVRTNKVANKLKFTILKGQLELNDFGLQEEKGASSDDVIHSNNIGKHENPKVLEFKPSDT